MYRREIVFSLVVVLSVSVINAQEVDADEVVVEQLRKVAQGNVEEVKKKLPDLLLEYPNNPGVIFLHAAVASDAQKALPLYEKIVREYPDSRWADDALWRIIQLYAIGRDTVEARYWFIRFQREYPTSEYLLFARLLVKELVGLPKDEVTVLRSAQHNNLPPSEVPNFPPSDTVKTPIGVDTVSSEPGIPPSPSPLPAADSVRYGLQVGIYTSKQTATREMVKYQRLNLRVEILEKQMGGIPHYAVVIGDYKSVEDAQRAKKVVTRFCQCKPFLIVK